MKKIGLYVGSFDPVHLGHMKIASYLTENKYVDEVLIVPTGNYWHKSNLTEITHRINMLKLIETDKVIIDYEFSSYECTYQIIDALKLKYDKAVSLIIGADNLEKFNLWDNYDSILENKVIVINRDGIDASKYIDTYEEKDSFIVVDGLEEMNISSTVIRNKIINNEDISNLVDERVSKYIKKNNLYKGR